MNNQQAFQKSALHILSQQRSCNVPTVDDTGNKDAICVYAGPDGQACGVGCLLPRRIAEQLDKAKLSAWVEVQKSNRQAAKAARKHLKGVDNALLESLQAIHDDNRGRGLTASCRSAADKRVIRRELQELGTTMGLNCDFLTAS